MGNMVSGLFRGHTISQPSKATIAHSVAEFAEIMAEYDCTPNEAADIMGVTRGTGAVLWRWLCLGLGEQPNELRA